jgi:hypothetical protein
MSNRTHTQNAFETTLASTLNPGVLSVDFTSVVGLSFPLYVTLDPEDPARLEYLKVTNIVGSTVTFDARNLEGSAGDVTHDPGAIVRLTWLKQMQDDLFDDIEALEAEDIVLADADTTHAALVDVHHVKYLDADAVAAMGVVGDGNDLNHVKLTDHGALGGLGDDDHSQYLLDSAHTIASHDHGGLGGLSDANDHPQYVRNDLTWVSLDAEDFKLLTVGTQPNADVDANALVQVIGDIVHFQWEVTVSSFTSAGTGNYRIPLPYTAALNSPDLIGFFRMQLNDGGATHLHGHIEYNFSNRNTAQFILIGGSAWDPAVYPISNADTIKVVCSYAR